MPKINAATVAEHRANMEEQLLDATEAILREGHTGKLKAGDVAARAGIARNSIYRYVEAVDDLRAKVVGRYLPAWIAAVDQAIDGADTPERRVVAWVRANLQQAAETGHGWLMRVVRTMPAGASIDDVAGTAHEEMGSRLREAWAQIIPDDPMAARIQISLTQGLVESGFRMLDSGTPADRVVAETAAAAEALVDAATAR